MVKLSSTVINDRIYVLRTRWERYVAEGTFELFIEFTVAVNSLAENFSRMRMPGLVRICEGLENTALSRLGSPATHPVNSQDIAALQRQMDTLLGAVASMRIPVADRRTDDDEHQAEVTDIDWIKPRSVWLIVAPELQEMAAALGQQLSFFGFQTGIMAWGEQHPAGKVPLGKR